MYTEADVKRLSLLATRVAQGERFSRLAAMSDDEIETLGAYGTSAHRTDPLGQLLDYQHELRRQLAQEIIAANFNRNVASATLDSLFSQAAASVAQGLRTEYASVLELDSAIQKLRFRAVVGAAVPTPSDADIDSSSHAGYAMLTKNP